MLILFHSVIEFLVMLTEVIVIRLRDSFKRFQSVKHSLIILHLSAHVVCFALVTTHNHMFTFPAPSTDDESVYSLSRNSHSWGAMQKKTAREKLREECGEEKARVLSLLALTLLYSFCTPRAGYNYSFFLALAAR